MWSAGVFFGVCLVILISDSSTWSGVAPTRRANWVSVLILFGMRLRRPIRNGLMSWRDAVASLMTMTPSRSSVARAGRSLGILIGIATPYLPSIARETRAIKSFSLATAGIASIFTV